MKKVRDSNGLVYRSRFHRWLGIPSPSLTALKAATEDFKVAGHVFAVTIAQLKMQTIAGKMPHEVSDPHAEADALLCEILRELGYGNVVDVYESIPKMYS